MSAQPTPPSSPPASHSPSSASLKGILVIDKPLGWSSMRAVSTVRRLAGGVKTGHAGTLDPLATGILVMALGSATKLIDRLMATHKRYLTTVDLSAFTTTDDLEGERTEVSVEAVPSLDDVRSAPRSLHRHHSSDAADLLGDEGGRKAHYKLARKGRRPRFQPRPVLVHTITAERYEWPHVDLSIHSGKGFYVRSLARDLGRAWAPEDTVGRFAARPSDRSMNRWPGGLKIFPRPLDRRN